MMAGAFLLLFPPWVSRYRGSGRDYGQHFLLAPPTDGNAAIQPDWPRVVVGLVAIVLVSGALLLLSQYLSAFPRRRAVARALSWRWTPLLAATPLICVLLFPPYVWPSAVPPGSTVRLVGDTRVLLGAREAGRHFLFKQQFRAFSARRPSSASAPEATALPRSRYSGLVTFETPAIHRSRWFNELAAAFLLFAGTWLVCGRARRRTEVARAP
jgi:hypothetical protein